MKKSKEKRCGVKPYDAKKHVHRSIKSERRRLRLQQKTTLDNCFDIDTPSEAKQTLTSSVLKDRSRVKKYAFDLHIPLPTPEKRLFLMKMKQNTPEWDLERSKRLGASSASCRVGHGNATIVDQWKLEMGLITREYAESTLKYFKHGRDTEPLAATQYIKHTGRVDVLEVGMYVHPTLGWMHASPDRLVGKQGLLEIKCPYFGHVPTEVPEKHIDQMMQQMAVCQRHWCDYMVYVSPEKYAIWRVLFSKDYWECMMGYLSKYVICLDKAIPPTMLKLRVTFPQPVIIKLH